MLETTAPVADSPETVLPQSHEPAAPISRTERIETIDILRGFAIFGVLVVNYVFFYQPPTLMQTGFRWPGELNQIVETLIIFFFMGKFYSLFSFLFGLGFSVLLLRAEGRGDNIVPLYRRRLFALLLFGILHGCLIWYGDILTTYAGVGFLLLLFRKRKQKTLMIWCFALVSVLALLVIGRYAHYQYISMDPKKFEKWEIEKAENLENDKRLAAESQEVHSNGSYREITEMRVYDYAKIQAISVVFSGQFLMLFLFGLYAGRRGVFHNIEENKPFLKQVFRWSFPLGIGGNLVFTYVFRSTDPSVPTLLNTVGQLLYLFCVPAMAFAYASGITLLLHGSSLWRQRLAPLGYVGRMALTNYLTHSVVGTLLFYSYGFGLFMKVDPAKTLLLCMALYAFQIPFSRWWLERFRFGPMEWIWRCLTYGRLQPFRLR